MTTFSPPFSKGVSPLTNIYDKTTTTNIMREDDEDTSTNIIEGMSTSQQLQQTWNTAFSKLKSSSANIAGTLYSLPEHIDKTFTKDSQKFTEFVYKTANHVPKSPTTTEVGLSEKTIRKQFSLNQILAKVNDIVDSINKRLILASTSDSYNTKQNIADDTQELIHKMQKVDPLTANGEDVYKNLMLTIESIQRKLNDLYDNANNPQIKKDLKTLEKNILSKKASSYISIFKDETCDGSDKRIKVLSTYAGMAKEIAYQIRKYLNKYPNVHAGPFIAQYRQFSKKMTDLYYVNPLNFVKSYNDAIRFFRNIKPNASYYDFDKQIKDLTVCASKFRFEQSATSKIETKVYDNSQLESDKKNDAEVMKRTMYMFLVVPFVIVATYNWYFMIVYRDPDKFATKEEPPDKQDPRPYNNDTRIKWDFSGLGSMQNIADHIMGSMIFPTHFVNHILLNDDYPLVPRLFSHKHALRSRAGILLLFSFIIYY